jgi:hypothetical protein
LLSGATRAAPSVIDGQRNKIIAAVRADHIVFKDVNEEPDALAAYGALLDDVRRRLHR